MHLEGKLPSAFVVVASRNTMHRYSVVEVNFPARMWRGGKRKERYISCESGDSLRNFF